MSTAPPYCYLHGDTPCRCHAVFARLQRQTAAASTGRRDPGSTSSKPRSSPKDTSSSSAYPSTSDATRSDTPLTGSAFSPLAPAFRNSRAEESDEAIRGPELPSTVQSSAQNRAQLLQRFYDLHLGSSSHARAIFQYEAIGSGNIGRATTTSAMDTLCIAQLATSFNDAQLMAESRRLYSQTMRMLGGKIRAIGDSKPSLDQLDDIIGACHALTASSWFRCVAAGSLDWTRHAQALLRVLKIYGWDAMSASTRKTFRYNWRYRAFWDGISRRVKVDYEEPAGERVPRDLASALLELGFRACELLARSDTFLLEARRKRPKELQVTALLTEIGSLIALFKKWHLAWTKTSPPRPRQKIVSARYFSAFRAVSREHFGVFPTASDFSHAAHERDFRILNICLLNLDEAITDIHATFPEHCKSSEMQLQLRAAEYDAATCAAELCMMVPWSSQPQNMAFAAIHSFQPLQYAAKYYRKHDRMLQLEWCKNVTETLSEKYGIRVQLWEDSDAFVTA